MKKTDWKAYCQGKYLLLDGATGSNLMKAGMPFGVCPERWILEHPDVLVNLQKAYIASGSHIIYAPTFTANRIKLAEYGLQDKQEEMIHGLVALSKEAAAGKALVAGDISMTGKQLEPIGDMSLEELIQVYKEQICFMEHAGVDLLIIETMMSLGETRAALIAAKEVCDLPVLVTMTFEANGKTLFGTDPQTAAIVLESLGADAIGVNCSTGPADMAKIIRNMGEVVSIPLIAKPNAGLPVASENGKTVYDMSPEIFAEEVQELIAAGAVILGGCCGTDPEYIEKLHQLTDGQIPMSRNLKKNPEFYLTSERKSYLFNMEKEPIIGQLINASVNQELQEELLSGSLDILAELAADQEDDGAEILDINLDMDGICVKEMMLQAIEELQMASSLPLSFHTAKPQVLEASLRHYPGHAMVYLPEADEETCEQLKNIAQKYGAYIYNYK